MILHIIGMIGVDGALYKSMEFMGEGLKSLSMEDRLCISNMAIEAGAKNGIFMVDEITEDYMTGRAQGEWKVFAPDEDAEYVATYDINLSAGKHEDYRRGRRRVDPAGRYRLLHQRSSGRHGTGCQDPQRQKST